MKLGVFFIRETLEVSKQEFGEREVSRFIHMLFSCPCSQGGRALEPAKAPLLEQNAMAAVFLLPLLGSATNVGLKFEIS